MKSILIINPNTSTDMTEMMMSNVMKDPPVGFNINFYTAESGLASINSNEDAMRSAEFAMEGMVRLGLHKDHDAYLVACFSVHPLVQKIQQYTELEGRRVHVMGIFDASIYTALQLLHSGGKFGIVTTGKYWEAVLTSAVTELLGSGQKTAQNKRCAGVACTGLTAGAMHTGRSENLTGIISRSDELMKEAVKFLCEDPHLEVIILGCAAMANMGYLVREALIEKCGEEKGRKVVILDGVMCGVGLLQYLVNSIPLH
jgi:Asp/Glu/hydantoin racemase